MVFVVIVRTTIHEDILLPGVPMDVTKQSELDFIFEKLHHGLGVVNGGLDYVARVVSPAVQIHSQQGGAGVPISDSIRVEHWDYFEDIVLPQLHCILVL